MSLPSLPSTHRWVDGGAVITFMGANVTVAPGGTVMTCWDRDTGSVVTDLYDQTGAPCSAVPVINNSFFCGVPTSVVKPVFSIGLNGPRVGGIDYGVTLAATQQLASDTATTVASQITRGASHISLDTDGVPYYDLSNPGGAVLQQDLDGIPYFL